ncbi:S41 family peptidase [Candidatus Caldatribacterium saccharofermentans]|uniref:S41 family peptidase n=1 Tax=Candidatus Caldatribacterium saccharofermentans TaxID=1454753 RepID=UPI003CFD6224
MRRRRLWLQVFLGILVGCGTLLLFFEWEFLAFGLGKEKGFENWEPLFETISLIREKFYSEQPVDEGKLLEEAIRGVLRALPDPYARYLDPEDYKIETSDTLEGAFSGIGIVIAIRDEKLTVVSPIAGSPAERAGVKAGDVILAIDGESTLGMSLDQAVKKMRGPEGTKVVLTLKREGVPEDITVEIVRSIIKIQSVSAEVLPEGIGLVRISEFHGRTADEVQKVLTDLIAQGVTGFILDLRNNPGGLLSAALVTAGFFVPYGEKLLLVEDRNGKREAITNFIHPLVSTPVVVLVNRGTASGAEILAGILRLAVHAPLVGEKTFGKGVIQEISPLSHGGGVIFTVSKYYLADGTDINGQGLIPDVLASGEDEQLKRGIKELKKLLKDHALAS